MVQDSEIRLKNIMDKLYHSPRPRFPALSHPGGGDVTASKGIQVRALAQRAQVGKVLPCRPWDRGDLIRRLATFKAMTWFGKPKDIGPVNCARRGWINVEMDTIVCEACGARLLFSTPPSWSLQQVEKAAAVFSLKLNNGHKLLCPWINNVCDESLASFPPSPHQALVEGFKERSHALWRLTTLPVISPLAIDYMRSPQLEFLLSMPVHPSITLSNGVRLIDDCRSKDQDGAAEDDISHGYYQALNIISLCGWEPRLLPYTVDFEDQFGPSTKRSNSLVSLNEVPCELQNLTNSSRSHIDIEGRKDIFSGEYLCDQSSTVLECRFCGACVGLWFFKKIPRPLEFFKIIIDGGRQGELSTGTADLDQGVEIPMVENFGRDHTSNIEKRSGLHLSIAGGPSPNKQLFRPKVSFPIVSRHLRAELLYDSFLRHQQVMAGKEGHISLQKESNDHHDDGSQAGLSLKRKQCELERSNSQLNVGGNHGDVDDSIAAQGRSEHTAEEILTPCSDVVIRDAVPCHSDSPTTDARESNDSFSKLDQSVGSKTQHHGDMGNGLACQGRSDATEEIHTPHSNIAVRDAVMCQNDLPTNDATESNDLFSSLDQQNICNSQFHVGGFHGVVGNVLAGECRTEHTAEEVLLPCTIIVTKDAIVSQSGSPTTDAKESKDPVSRLDDSNCRHTLENGHCGPISRLDVLKCGHMTCDLSTSASSSVTHVNLTTHSKTCEMGPYLQTAGQTSVFSGFAKEVSISVIWEENVDHLSGNLRPSPVTDFDPIKQHRPFCPWISEGKNMPGWKAVLSALNNIENNNTSQQPVQTSADSSLLDETSDPIVSVRKLFMSPVAKKMKRNQ